LAREYDLERTDLAFYSDNYISNNPYKSSLVNLRILKKRKIEKRKIANPRHNEVLRNIRTFNGDKLPEYHQKLHSKSEGKIIDVSDVFSAALEQSLSSGYIHEKVWVIESGVGTPYYWNEERKVYVHKRKDGKEEEKEVEEIISLASRGLARPDAKWYYQHIYLLLPGILVQNLILAVTPWEEDDEKIKEFAKKSYEKVGKICGVYPLTLPFYNMENLENARNIYKHPSYLILEHKPEIRLEELTGNFYEDSKRIEEGLIAYANTRKKA
jgi:hypothetical protein